MLALRRAVSSTHAPAARQSARSLSTSSSSEQQDPEHPEQQRATGANKHKARENRQRVAEGAVHAAAPALKGVADMYTKKGRASEGAYFVKEDREALHRLVKKWSDEDAKRGKSGN